MNRLVKIQLNNLGLISLNMDNPYLKAKDEKREKGIIAKPVKYNHANIFKFHLMGFEKNLVKFTEGKNKSVGYIKISEITNFFNFFDSKDVELIKQNI